MPSRFPLIPVVLTGDPFCDDGYCGDPSPVFAPTDYLYFRWEGTLRKRTNYGAGPLTDYPITSFWKTTAGGNYGSIYMQGFTGNPGIFTTINSGIWGANLQFLLNGAGFFATIGDVGWIQDTTGGLGSINNMANFGGAVAEIVNGNVAFETVGGRWQFANADSANPPGLVEWAGL
jgi:hypothetical protein